MRAESRELVKYTSEDGASEDESSGASTDCRSGADDELRPSAREELEAQASVIPAARSAATAALAPGTGTTSRAIRSVRRRDIRLWEPTTSTPTVRLWQPLW